MTDTTYVAVAPDGTKFKRTSHRIYTHAVLTEGANGWQTIGFCGRLDLAEKKAASLVGGVVVEAAVCALPDPLAMDEEKSVDEKIREAKVTVPEGAKPKQTIGRLVRELLIDDDAPSYDLIVEAVLREFPDAKTTRRSVASSACSLRRAGFTVPMRSKRP